MKIVKLIDTISEWTGALAAWLVIPLMVVVMIEVFMRHVLNSPTVWGYDVLWMLFSAQFLLGGAFTLLRGGHIRIDIVYGGLSERAKQIYDIINTLIVILPPAVLLTWAGIAFAADAWTSGEKLSTTNWFFPAGPSKSLIPIGFFLLALQCVAEILRNINELKKGKPK
ncbi:DctQ9: C4-TRAP dicarboxylate transporter [Desulfosarcina variabilis str. Montpellier]|uniref:TRAP transporter small permease subunit n=1 Tax=Desulfosarcina variabilis TaxID=2300 RepID=UPI003AFB47A8